MQHRGDQKICCATFFLSVGACLFKQWHLTFGQHMYCGGWLALHGTSFLSLFMGIEKHAYVGTLMSLHREQT